MARDSLDDCINEYNLFIYELWCLERPLQIFVMSCQKKYIYIIETDCYGEF